MEPSLSKNIFAEANKKIDCFCYPTPLIDLCRNLKFRAKVWPSWNYAKQLDTMLCQYKAILVAQGDTEQWFLQVTKNGLYRFAGKKWSTFFKTFRRKIDIRPP
jgi:hypothetical protein